MDKEKLYKLAERYQNKADTAYNAYQETGIARYDTARRNNEDLAESGGSWDFCDGRSEANETTRRH